MTTERVRARSRILVVDDDRAFRVSTSTLLREEGHVVVEVADGSQAVDALEAGGFDLILLDVRMPGIDGISLVEVLRRWGEGTPILMISGFGTVETAVEALHTGADDFLTKPVEPDVLTGKVADLLERRPSLGAGSGEAPDGMVGRAPPMRELFAAMEKVASSDTTVLVHGETGTGKELVARALHRGSPRAEGPFLAVNCSSLAENLLESELFGHVKGAFTGASRDKPGLFQAADAGTLLLDEIGDVSPGLQQRLLRVLQEQEFIPVGAVTPRRADVRIIAATHEDLEEEVRAGRFRKDLFYRLDVFRLEVPPLRDRGSDIPLLVEHFLQSRTTGTAAPSVSPLAMRLLQSHAWPGNVRELFSVLESALIRAGGAGTAERLEAQHLPEKIREGRPTDATADARPGKGREREGGSGPGGRGPPGDRHGPAGAGEESLERYVPPDSPDEERGRILDALAETDGVRSRAARLLGMGRTTLWRKMKEYGIEVE